MVYVRQTMPAVTGKRICIALRQFDMDALCAREEKDLDRPIATLNEPKETKREHNQQYINKLYQERDKLPVDSSQYAELTEYIEKTELYDYAAERKHCRIEIDGQQKVIYMFNQLQSELRESSDSFVAFQY